MSRLEELLEKQKSLEAAIVEETGKAEAEAVLNTIGGNVATVVTQAASKAGVDIAVLHGKFFALEVADGKLAVTVAAKATRKTNGNGNGGGTGTGNGNGNGEWEYFLKDGRGPFAGIQDAMTELGIPESDRPNHKRYDRLSADWKDKIERRAKATTADAEADPATAEASADAEAEATAEASAEASAEATAEK
ncbi:hypothetical protein LCGC14_1442370 [marine sediment metagenome]|uniref:Uncharacterized protein n=1 Tax=marine sediment metagenome TaxID=412755 RepID=A0A0F9JKC3_9ZZZZ